MVLATSMPSGDLAVTVTPGKELPLVHRITFPLIIDSEKCEEELREDVERFC